MGHKKQLLAAFGCLAAVLAALLLASPRETARAQVQPTYAVYLPFLVNRWQEPAVVSPNDPYFANGYQWGLYNYGQDGGTAGADIDARRAWGLTVGESNAAIAIVDSGIDASHPEFAGKVLSGWNCVDNSPNTNDDFYHGTMVAGIAAANTSNATGVAGVAWNTRLMPVKVLDGSGHGTDSTLACGIVYAADHGARVINLSLGTASLSSTLNNAIDYAYSRGSLLVAAAGNCGVVGTEGCAYQNQPSYPAASPHVLAVAATDRNDSRASFSTQGSYVDVAAPGQDILSTYPGGYASGRGTSFAAPYVSGLAGLLLARYPGYSPDQLAAAIVNNAEDLGPIIGKDPEYGCGRINAYRSLAYGTGGAGCPGWSFAAAAVTAQAMPAQAKGAFKAGKVLVKFKSAADARAKGHAREAVPGLGIYEVRVPPGQELAKVAELQADPGVEFAEPDYVVYALGGAGR
ncbi:MAG: S8 family peptidase [Chloroflexi bacterium]|nr:S8 family peptidase [Chloroflexota bacterium]